MENWEEGATYDNFMGRWSRAVAGGFLDWLQVPTGARWLDVGCGTGALAQVILANSAPHRVTAVDPSAAFIAAAGEALGEGVEALVGDAMDLGFESGAFDATVSGLALNFVPDPGLAVTEMRRVTREDGVVAAYVWDYASGMQMLRAFWDVALALEPSIADLDEAARFPVCDPQRLGELFAEAGLGSVETTDLVVPTVFESFDDFWQPFLGGQGPAPSYVASLDEDRCRELRDRLEQSLDPHDGPISLSARAFGVHGRR